MNSGEPLPEMTRSTQGYVGLRPTKTPLQKTSEEEGKRLEGDMQHAFPVLRQPLFTTQGSMSRGQWLMPTKGKSSSAEQ